MLSGCVCTGAKRERRRRNDRRVYENCSSGTNNVFVFIYRLCSNGKETICSFVDAQNRAPAHSDNIDETRRPTAGPAFILIKSLREHICQSTNTPRLSVAVCQASRRRRCRDDAFHNERAENLKCLYRGARLGVVYSYATRARRRYTMPIMRIDYVPNFGSDVFVIQCQQCVHTE